MAHRNPDPADLLTLAESRYRSLLALSPDVMFSLALDGAILALNPAFESLTGWKASEWTGRAFLGLIHADDRAAVSGQLRHALDGRVPPLVEARVVTRSGDCLVVELIVACQHQDGEPLDVLGIARDVTQPRRAEEALIQREAQLQQAQKMEAIGRLAGGIAHDFNNLLTIITGYSQLLLSRLRSDDDVRSDVEEIRKAAARAAALTQQLLAFSRRQILLPKVLNLNSIVETLAVMLQRLIGEDVHLVTALDPDLGQVKADPCQIEQVVMNLAVNGRDAMPMGGKLTIETANVDITEALQTEDAALPAGRYAMISVDDTGFGMDSATRARIFEPFFTTKEQGKGTGLGLSTVYGIVKQSGGYILVNSTAGHGTTFKVYLPLVDETLEVGGLDRWPVTTTPSGTETILLVEDEPTVRVLVRDTLRLFGYSVLEARHGFEAQLIGQQRAHLDLLVTDVVMPQMSGCELADGLMRTHPEMKILYMSGYTESPIVEERRTGISVSFIQKPFTPDELARKVRETLDAGKAQYRS